VIWKIRENTVSFDRTILMGVVNITPDSFSDGGRYLDPEAACRHAAQLLEEGADILDFGAESTRPCAKPVTAKEELDRLLPVLKLFLQKHQVSISIDTTKPEVARKCLEAGAHVINDVSGLKSSGAEMIKAVKKFGAGMILMHSRGTPETMQGLTDYQEVVGDVIGELQESAHAALQGGIGHDQIVIDPGLGLFAKTTEQNLAIIKNLKAFHAMGFPVMIGPSRKSFIGQVTGRETDDREFGTAACVAAAVEQGVQILRVHEVKAMRDVVRVTEAIKKLKPIS